MYLNKIEPKNETEDLSFLTTKKCETLIEQTHRKAEETQEFKMTKSIEVYQFKPPMLIQVSWMIGLIKLEVYKAIFDKNTKNNKDEIYTGPLDTELHILH